MIRYAEARVGRVVWESDDIQELTVDLAGGELAVCYPSLTGRARPGDVVMLNTTAVDLALGTGGRHFVVWIAGRQPLQPELTGHIMKMRYAPMQVCTGAYEEDPTNRASIDEFRGLAGMPVVVCELHSMIAPVFAGIAGRAAYIMTDGAALPIAFSNTVRRLRREGLMCASITAGHAFGGDYEAVSVYSALVAAPTVARCEAAVVAMGPGIVGTGAKYGFSGIEQGYIVDAVNRMGGRPILVPRLSRRDPRPRHRPVSHHTITVLEDVCCTPATCVIASDMDPAFSEEVRAALADAVRGRGHSMESAPGRDAVDSLLARGVELSTMGRGFEEEPEFFLTCAAAGVYARKLLDDADVERRGREDLAAEGD
ncbi:MAG: DUF3866 family protein [Clostridia bacterium]|nr:DUF3866 family protein [Clostridia bacterium]